MHEAHILGVALDITGRQIILLKPLGVGSDRLLPIWIGEQEAASISIADEVLERAGVADTLSDREPDLGSPLSTAEQEARLEEFREFLAEVDPEDFGEG